MKPLFVVSYAYPPMGGAGVFRWLKFTKYLPSYGYEPIVFCAEDPRYAYRDAALLSEISAGVKVVRRTCREPSHHRILRGRIARTRLAPRLPDFRRMLDFPDNKQPWAMDVADLAVRMARRIRPAAVITTSMPASSHLAGLRLQKRCGVPWIAEFRDLWSEGPLFTAGWPRWLRWMHRRLERRVVRSADHCLFAFPGGAERMAALHGMPLESTTTICNGYDPDDFAGWPAMPALNGRIEIVHTGSFYGAHNPEPLRRALLSPAFREQIPLERIRLTFVGGDGGVRFDDIPGLDVRVISRVPHAAALEYMKNAHVLLCLVANEIGLLSVTGKVFEYIAANRPILAVVPPNGPAADVVRRTGAGIVADPDDPRQIAAALRGCLERIETHQTESSRNAGEISRFNRQCQAEELAGLLDRVIAEQGIGRGETRAVRPNGAEAGLSTVCIQGWSG